MIREWKLEGGYSRHGVGSLPGACLDSVGHCVIYVGVDSEKIRKLNRDCRSTSQDWGLLGLRRGNIESRTATCEADAEVKGTMNKLRPSSCGNVLNRK